LFTYSKIGIAMFLLYIIAHITRVAKNYHNEKSIVFSFIYKMVFPFYTLASLFCYFPSYPKYKVKKLNG
jgi:hypothetical protein